MSKNLLIRCDYFASSGVGHLKRCNVLAETLQENGIASVFALDAEIEHLPFDVNFPIRRMQGEFNEIEDAIALIHIAQEIGASTILGDSYRISDKWISCLQNAEIAVVLFDDLGVGGNCNLRVDYCPSPLEPTGSAAALLGPAFFVTDSPRLEPRQGPPQQAILHAGGTGNFALAQRAYCSASQLARSNGIGLTWLCPSKATETWLGDVGLLDESDAVIGWQRDGANLWSDFDIVIGPTSTSLYEAILQGTVPVSFPISSTQTNDRSTWLRLGHALHLTSEEIESEEIVRATMQIAVGCFDLILEQLQKYSAVLDGAGSKRIASAISTLVDGSVLPNVASKHTANGIRECELRDAESFLIARNAPRVRALSTDPSKVISWPEHLEWWLQGKSERFVLEEDGDPQVYFWHRPKRINGRDYLIGGWFPANDKPAFMSAVKVLQYQLEYCADRFPDHLWLATIHRENSAVLALNRRYGFLAAEPETLRAVPNLFPGTTDAFEVLQRKASHT